MNSAQAIWSMLLPKQRSAALVLLGMMIVAMLLEMLGIGLVVPALAFMTRGDAEPSPLMASWLARLGNPTQTQLIMGGLVVLLGVYAVKTLFLLVVAYWQSRFVAALQASMGRRLFANYLAQPWTFHLQRNSAELARNILEVQGFGATCTSLLGTAAESLVLVGIVALLLWFEPLGAMVVGGVLAAATWLFSRFTSPRLVRWGEGRYRHLALLQQHLQQGLGGAKDVKIRGCEAEFVEQYRKHSDIVAHLQARQSLVQQAPRLWLEMLAVVALCLLTAVMLWSQRPLAALIPSLGLFATAAFRLLPSVNRLAQATQNLRYSASVINVLQRDLALTGPVSLPTSDRIPFRDAIVVDGVTFCFPNNPTPALDNVTIRIPYGSSVGIVGGSGAGKSTAVDILLGLLDPTAGKVTVDGIDIHHQLRGWQNLIGYVPQSIYLCDDSLRRNVAFGVPSERIDEAALDRAIRAASLDTFVATLPAGLETLVGERGVRLSGGQRQRIGIARALYHDPEVLVLDEATSALDTATESDVMAAVNSLHGRKTLVIVAHRLSTVEQCDVLVRLEHGRLVKTGSYADVVPR